jgi:molybdenum ABC transporter molybdate-binding protein
MQQRRGFLMALVAWLAALVPAPGGASAAWAKAAPRAPVVLAAASLQEALNEAADRWAAHGHPRPVLSFAASALARQVVNGAPADLFLSADEEWMDYLAHAPGRPGGWIRPGTRVDLLANRLVLVAPAASPLKLTIAPGFALARALDAAGGPGARLATGQVDAVPAGKYAKAALVSLKVWPQVQGRIAGVDSVRARWRWWRAARRLWALFTPPMRRPSRACGWWGCFRPAAIRPSVIRWRGWPPPQSRGGGFPPLPSFGRGARGVSRAWLRGEVGGDGGGQDWAIIALSLKVSAAAIRRAAACLCQRLAAGAAALGAAGGV